MPSHTLRHHEPPSAAPAWLPNIYESAARVKRFVTESDLSPTLEAWSRSSVVAPGSTSQAGPAGNIYSPSMGQE
jgi:hypothetical protein